MKLFYSPAACSLAIHISLREAELPVTLEKVNTTDASYGNGKSFLDINPNGYVPVLQLDDGSIFTEGVMLQQWIAAQKPEKNLMPKVGSTEYFKATEWLAFISTELHKGFVPLFFKETSDEMRKIATNTLLKRFTHVNNQLKGKEYLLGNTYTSADAYLFTVYNWANFVSLDLTSFTNILSHKERMMARPAVRQAMEAEQLKN